MLPAMISLTLPRRLAPPLLWLCALLAISFPLPAQADASRSEYDRANRLLDSGKLDEAISAYGKAISLRPAYAAAYCDRGTAYRLKGDYVHAVADFTKALRLRPKYKAAVNNLAYTYRLQGDYPRAIKTYKRAAALDPANSARWEHLAVCQCLAGRYRDGAVSAKRALRINPSSVAARRQLGLAYAALGDSRRAAEQFRVALPRMSDDALRESVKDIEGVQARNRSSRALGDILNKLKQEIARRSSGRTTTP